MTSAERVLTDNDQVVLDEVDIVSRHGAEDLTNHVTSISIVDFDSTATTNSDIVVRNRDSSTNSFLCTAEKRPHELLVGVVDKDGTFVGRTVVRGSNSQ